MMSAAMSRWSSFRSSQYSPSIFVYASSVPPGKRPPNLLYRSSSVASRYGLGSSGNHSRSVTRFGCGRSSAMSAATRTRRFFSMSSIPSWRDFS